MTDWDRLVREHGPRVFSIAYRILGQAADAEDVTQDVFLQAHQLQQTQVIRHWGAFLRRLAACRALDRLRLRKSHVSLDGVPLTDHTDGPEAVLLGRELAERLRVALASLPPREAEVFCLRYFEDRSYQEIADSLGIRTGAVAVALHKARTRLEGLLGLIVTEEPHVHAPESRAT